MKIAFIATYPPRECGIGTFTNNLFKSMLFDNNNEHEGYVIALNNLNSTNKYPKEVELTISQEHHEDYIKAAKYINLSDTDLCILEHEFGIFGGRNGLYILSLLHQLEVSLIVTLHTLLEVPSYDQKIILQEICKRAKKVVVMSHKAVEFLVNIYNVPKDKIALIEHGVPDIYFNPDKSKKEFLLENKKVILTFGFVGRGKGIETVIKALPEVVDKHPDVIYIILGKTHPNVLRHSGEEYRIFLMDLVTNLQLEKHVIFLNEFVDKQNLFKYLYACDIYITPYLNEAQITSGTLSYAIGVGSAVLSTPFWHAVELLSEGRGRFFNFNDSDNLSLILTELFDDPEELNKLKRKAYQYGREITWTKTGYKYVKLAENVLKETPPVTESKNTFMDFSIMPSFSLTHINRLTDETGIIQHAKYCIPNLKEGYSLDDNARALLMVLMEFKQKKDRRALELSSIYLSYIHYMQNEDGTFRNFLGFNRNFLEEVGSEDSFGRTIWALGYLMCNAPNDAFYQTARLLFFNASPHFTKLKTVRGIANTIIGLSYYLESNSSDFLMSEILYCMSNKLIKHYEENSTSDWKWFEPVLTYDNGILPLALLHSSEILNDDKTTSIALESMNFLTETTLKNNCLSIIGNEKWYKKDGERSVYAQQPIDAMAMVLMYHQAYLVTNDIEYINNLHTSFLWFLGENDLRIRLYDFETKGCCDGLENYGVNRNQGAESSLAYLISHLTVLQAFDNSSNKLETVEFRKNPKLSHIKNRKYVNKKISKQSYSHKRRRSVSGSYGA